MHAIAGSCIRNSVIQCIPLVGNHFPSHQFLFSSPKGICDFHLLQIKRPAEAFLIHTLFLSLPSLQFGAHPPLLSIIHLSRILSMFYLAVLVQFFVRAGIIFPFLNKPRNSKGAASQLLLSITYVLFFKYVHFILVVIIRASSTLCRIYFYCMIVDDTKGLGCIRFSL